MTKHKGVDVRIRDTEQSRQQSQAEEIANSISHGLGLIAAFIGAPILIVEAVRNESGRFVVGSSVFGVTLIILYFASTVYHALPPGKAKRVFRVIEHCAIFLLIAGTYTPLALGVLRGAWGWSLLGVVWGLALLGVLLKGFYLASRPILFTSLYLMMGWVAVIAIYPLFVRMPTAGFLLLFAGGFFYTVGVAFFITDSRVKYRHLIWHFFVIAGTLCHYFMILWYAA